MEISEVGMTPEIIQKVRLSFLHTNNLHICFVFVLFSHLDMYFLFFFVAPRQSYYPHHREEEGKLTHQEISFHCL